MKRSGCLAFFFVALLLPACSQESAPPEAHKPPQPAAEQQTRPAAAVEEKVAAGSSAVAEKGQESVAANPVAEQQTTEAVQPAVQPAVKPPAPAPAPEAKPATTPAPAPASPAPKQPGKVAYEASMGTVTFNHATHAGKFACSLCHTTDPPQAIAMSKGLAHDQLCKVCHKEAGGEAPTACNGCHKK